MKVPRLVQHLYAALYGGDAFLKSDAKVGKVKRSNNNLVPIFPFAAPAVHRLFSALKLYQ